MVSFFQSSRGGSEGGRAALPRAAPAAELCRQHSREGPDPRSAAWWGGYWFACCYWIKHPRIQAGCSTLAWGAASTRGAQRVGLTLNIPVASAGLRMSKVGETGNQFSTSWLLLRTSLLSVANTARCSSAPSPRGWASPGLLVVPGWRCSNPAPQSERVGGAAKAKSSRSGIELGCWCWEQPPSASAAARVRLALQPLEVRDPDGELGKVRGRRGPSRGGVTALALDVAGEEGEGKAHGKEAQVWFSAAKSLLGPK